VRQLLEVVLPVAPWNAAMAIAWQQAQRRRKEAARNSHRKRWMYEHPIGQQLAL
jgi:hypothetical protein